MLLTLRVPVIEQLVEHKTRNTVHYSYMEQPLILIIEDSIELAESLEDLFTLNGITTHIARSGHEGVAAALSEHPDLILLDIRLPDIDGYQVFNQIRADAWGAGAKIMVLTASESISTIAKNIDLPIEYILFKPSTSLSQILETVQTRLRH